MSKDALVVVDMQNYFCKQDHAFLRFTTALAGAEDTSHYLDRLQSTVVPNIRRLLNLARSRGHLVLFTEFGSKTTDGSDLPPWAVRHNEMAKDLIGESIYLPVRDAAARTIAEITPQPDELVIERSTSGPLAGTQVATMFSNIGVERVVVTGVATDVCVTGWSRELADSGFRVTVPVDACASPIRRCHDAALEMSIPAFSALTETRALLTGH